MRQAAPPLSPLPSPSPSPSSRWQTTQRFASTVLKRAVVGLARPLNETGHSAPEPRYGSLSWIFLFFLCFFSFFNPGLRVSLASA